MIKASQQHVEQVSRITLFDGLSIAEFDALPVFCRGVGKWKREASVARRVCRLASSVRWGLVDCRRAVRRRPSRWSVTGEAVTVDGFDDETGGGHGREARVEGGRKRTGQAALSSANGRGFWLSTRAAVIW